jgi:hypothetical protein
MKRPWPLFSATDLRVVKQRCLKARRLANIAFPCGQNGKRLRGVQGQSPARVSAFHKACSRPRLGILPQVRIVSPTLLWYNP